MQIYYASTLWWRFEYICQFWWYTIVAVSNKWDLHYIAIWLKVNKLPLFIKKTHFVTLTKTNKQTDVALNFEGKAISEVSQTVFLGFHIENKLIWHEHIHCRAGKLSRGIGVVAKARKLLNSDALITLSFSFIHLYFCYCNHVQRSTYVTHSQILIIVETDHQNYYGR